MSKTITRLQNNDEEIFQEIYLEYHDKLHQYIFQQTNSSYYAHEVTQITFIKLWERRNRLKVDIPISSQIFQMAKTTMIDVLRKMERERLKTAHIYINTRCAEQSGYEWIEGRDAESILQRAMEVMPPMRKKVFSMKVENQYSYKEIAAALSISIKTVNKHLELAMQQVRPFFKTFLILLIIFKK